MDGNEDETTYQHMAEVFNDAFSPEKVEEEESVFTTEISVITMFWNFVHSAVLVFILFRMNVMAGAMAVTGAHHFQLAEALDNHSCRLTEDIYYLLYTIIALTATAIIPPILAKFSAFLKKQFRSAVSVEAERIVAEAI